MTHTQVSLSILIGVAVLGMVLSGVVWLARQQSRQARILILTKGGVPVQDRPPDGSEVPHGASPDSAP